MNKYIVYGLLAAILVVALLGLRGTMQPLGAEGDTNLTNLVLSGNLSFGSTGGRIASSYTGTATHNPPSLTWQSLATTTVTVTGAAAGDPCIVGFTVLDARGGMEVTCQFQAANTALVTFVNSASTTTDNATGTLRVTSIGY